MGVGNLARPERWRVSPKDQLRANDAATKFYAAAADKVAPPELLNNLPPKRTRIKRPVDGRPVGPSEHQEQCAVISWWWRVHNTYQLPPFALLAVPNGGARDPITGSRLKAEGVRRGTPDLFLEAARRGYHGLRIEMKAIGGRESEEQEEFGLYLERAGYQFRFCHGADVAITTIKDYLA